MAETALDRDLSGPADGETGPGVQAPGGSAPALPVALAAPPAGEPVAIAVQAGEMLVLDPTVQGLGLEPSGDDIPIGGLGDDDLQGGSGADVFLFDFDGGQEAPGDDIIGDFDPGNGDLLRFSDVFDMNSDGADLDDFSAAVSSVQDDGKDVTIVFEDGGSLMLDGLGTGAIDSVNALLNEIGQNAVEVV